MTGTERIRALLSGDPIDRTPISGWYHMPLVDRDVDRFTAAIIESTNQNHWDFIKIMTNGHFYTEAFGGEIAFSTTYNKWGGTVLRYPIETADDARKLPVLELDNPVWKRELQILKNLKAHYGEALPILATVFSPITAVQDCIGAMNPVPLLQLMNQAPDALHCALEAVTRTNLNYLDGLFEAGADGIFLANQYASDNILTDAQYAEFCFPYENRVLDHCKGHTWFNVAHVHGSSNLKMESYFSYEDEVLQALNWENCPANVPPEKITTMADVHAKSKKTIVAGIDHANDFKVDNGNPGAVKQLLKERFKNAVAEIGSNRFVFAPGCVLATGGSSLNVLIWEVAEELGRSKIEK